MCVVARAGFDAIDKAVYLNTNHVTAWIVGGAADAELVAGDSGDIGFGG